jgi:hypothetical protein
MSRARSATFTYSARHRWAYVPTLLFLVVVLVILAVDPGLVWPDMDAGTRRSALLLLGGLATGFAVALGARWASPFRFELESDALLAVPLLGPARRVAYRQILDVVTLPKTFMRGVPEVVLQVEGGRPVTIRTDLVDYQQLEKALRKRLAPGVQARWKQVRQVP